MSEDCQIPIPPVEQWSTPISWVGSEARPHDDYSRFFPITASFVRAELLFQLFTEPRPGWKETRYQHRYGLMRVSAILERGRPVGMQAEEVHCIGLDGLQRWSFRPEMRNGRQFWRLYVGDSFPAQALAPPTLLEEYRFDYLEIQTLVPCELDRRVVRLHLRGNFERVGDGEDSPAEGD